MSFNIIVSQIPDVFPDSRLQMYLDTANFSCSDTYVLCFFCFSSKEKKRIVLLFFLLVVFNWLLFTKLTNFNRAIFPFYFNKNRINISFSFSFFIRSVLSVNCAISKFQVNFDCFVCLHVFCLTFTVTKIELFFFLNRVFNVAVKVRLLTFRLNQYCKY